MIHDNFKNAPDWEATRHELVGKKLRIKVTGLKVKGEAVAAYLNTEYNGKPDAHTAIVVNHDPVNWGGQIYTQSALWLFDNRPASNSWYEVIEDN